MPAKQAAHGRRASKTIRAQREIPGNGFTRRAPESKQQRCRGRHLCMGSHSPKAKFPSKFDSLLPHQTVIIRTLSSVMSSIFRKFDSGRMLIGLF